jgi:hypothetical protein
VRHGETTGEVDVETWLGDDPALALVTADLHAWMLAHPCECEGLCTCEDEPV